MALIPAEGRTFRQGGKAPFAGLDELPAFRSGFTYDFHMDRTEVTQGQYSDLMGRDPSSPLHGRGRDYPVNGVSWFDAALYANARSKAAGFDTVYVYSMAKRTASGTVYDLAGFEARLDRQGFRLPTEAEWEYAASDGGRSGFPWGDTQDSSLAGQYAWYASNSEGRAHPVGLLKANGFGLHDMAGNVMEWVGDWKGVYPSDTASDFAGARDPGPQGETPVKGGAFRYGWRDLRVSNRSATYATIRSATAEYVGFRCAFGAVPKPKFTLADGSRAETDPVLLGLTRLGSLVEGRAARLVFINASPRARRLAYVDYGRQPVRVREFGDTVDAFHPSISPDGRWVAYGTAAEGAVGGSLLFIRSLDSDSASPASLGPGFIPRWWVDPATRDTFLVYATSGADNMQSTWEQAATLAMKMTGGVPQGPPATWAAGGFHDGRSRDGRWMATGFRRLKLRDGSTGEVRTLFTAPQNGKAAGDTSQVCNVSIAPDATGRTLFLDFGYESASAITGSWYDIHAVAFMAGPDGKVLRWYRSPRGEKAWDDLEWTNVPRYAVAAATDPAGGHGRLYLLDLHDSAASLLASGAYLTTPALWLGDSSAGIDSILEPDSLGHYNDPATDAYQGIFSVKMARFWDQHQRLEVFFTGSSHVYSAIDASLIKGMVSFNAGYAACGWLGQEQLIRSYALPHCPRLKVLVMEAFPGWMNHPDGDFTWKSQISATVGVKYDSAHGFWKDGLPAGFESLVARAPVWDGVIMDSMGNVNTETVGWGEMFQPSDAEWSFESETCQAVLARMEAFVREMADRGIHVVLVNHPTHPGYRGGPYLGPYGPRMEVARQIIDRLKAMESISPRVHFYDAHRFGEHDYTDGDAFNWGHLSGVGALKLTSRLDSLIRTFPP